MTTFGQRAKKAWKNIYEIKPKKEEKYEETQKEEKKRIQKDKIIDEEEDESKEYVKKAIGKKN